MTIAVFRLLWGAAFCVLFAIIATSNIGYLEGVPVGIAAYSMAKWIVPDGERP